MKNENNYLIAFYLINFVQNCINCLTFKGSGIDVAFGLLILLNSPNFHFESVLIFTQDFASNMCVNKIYKGTTSILLSTQTVKSTIILLHILALQHVVLYGRQAR